MITRQIFSMITIKSTLPYNIMYFNNIVFGYNLFCGVVKCVYKEMCIRDSAYGCHNKADTLLGQTKIGYNTCETYCWHYTYCYFHHCTFIDFYFNSVAKLPMFK